MKKDIHPKYGKAVVRCACGNVMETQSTKPEIFVDICSACHPFFTGQQKLVDTAGRIEKFQKKYKGQVVSKAKDRVVKERKKNKEEKSKPALGKAAKA